MTLCVFVGTFWARVSETIVFCVFSGSDFTFEAGFSKTCSKEAFGSMVFQLVCKTRSKPGSLASTFGEHSGYKIYRLPPLPQTSSIRCFEAPMQDLFDLHLILEGMGGSNGSGARF